MRQAKIDRVTAETEIHLKLELDGRGENRVETGCGFLDHMLTLFASHGRFDLDLVCRGDLEVDAHHTTEDVGIALGQAFGSALGDMRGVTRYGFMILPMDEALILAAVDLSGRGVLGFDLPVPAEKVGVLGFDLPVPAKQVGSFDTELVKEFFLAFTREAKIALHLKELAGENSHHIIEGAFKATARALRQAVKIDPDAAGEIPSTKGVLV
ncbi:MAG: imidazoleglycerol-phosphate dehydratase HisB [Clostridia bacterium]|nr:imidazoleglycerol-phosphate dehydratase HisB [Clostridia bacterium]